MSRPKKEGADYFPHFAANGKTMFTLESMYGNDGYAFWFKLLEILCTTEGHYYRVGKAPEWLFLVSKTRVTEDKATAILKTLADLDAIDADLLAKNIIWCDKLVENLRPVYTKRRVDLPQKPGLPEREKTCAVVSGAESTQSKVKESKGEKITPLPPRKPGVDCPVDEIVNLYREICVSFPGIKKLTDQRKKKLRVRWKEDRERQGLEWWRNYFTIAAGSGFLCGENGKWRADFDFLLREDKMIKILEGGFDNKTAKNDGFI